MECPQPSEQLQEEEEMAETQDTKEASERAPAGRRVMFTDAPEGSPVFHGTDIPVQRLIDYMDQMYNLYAFLEDHPAISAERALDGIREYVRADMPAHSERGRVSGIPVFRGTRLPMHYLFGHLADGVNLDEFLLDYPYPEREQAVRAIQLGALLLEAMAYECALAEAGDSPHPPGDNYRGDRRSVSRESVTTQLHEAAWLGRAETVQALIAAAGADPNSYSIRRYGGNCSAQGCPSGSCRDRRGIALSGCRSQPALDRSGTGGTPLHLATWSGDPETIRALIAGGADPNARDEYGRTPVEWANMRGEHQLAKVIAEAEVPPQQGGRRAE